MASLFKKKTVDGEFALCQKTNKTKLAKLCGLFFLASCVCSHLKLDVITRLV